ncbi:ankyrin repeat domain-containing protein [Nitrospirillum sp. BR 11828]|uniref:ankyrin repeat domain-containing protein n=1 Tax=Nitrospirillum sp. BR 11828 TaxID=3104325 RepID=UPI002ACAB144|nr:ankyrin repeat domain-containing protein [Nitrospirillum sp. BR 11828]MDZ5649086.1 lysozyme inhibitor LprI family protein [Nitrospirillum sp. BR 11828]
MRRLWALAAVLLPLSIASVGKAADSPSFDCAKAASPIEKRICADPGLAARDRQMADAYKRLLDVSGPQHDRVVRNQRMWLKALQLSCGLADANPVDTPACVETAQQNRLEALTQLMEDIRGGLDVTKVDEDLAAQDDKIINIAFSEMAEAPAVATAILRAYHTPTAKIGLATALRLTSRRPAAHAVEVRQLLREVAADFGKDAFPYLREDAEKDQGDAKSLIPFLHVVGDEVRLSCKLLYQHPELIRALSPEIYTAEARFTPMASCDKSDFPNDSIAKYSELVHAHDGSGFVMPCGGSESTRLNDLMAVFYSEAMTAAPQYLALKVSAGGGETDDGRAWQPPPVPLEEWSYLSAWNRAKFQAVQAQFQTTTQEVAAYYQRHFNMPAEQARRYAYINLIAGYGWTYVSAPAINIAIMNADVRPSLADLLAKGTPVEVPAEQKGEPLLSLAVARPAAIAPLLAAHAPVNAVNPMGKTPLMTAAQFNSPEALSTFIQAGAEVNTQSLAPEKIADNYECAAYHITHGQRTALMYAAANAGLPVIQALLAAGADTRPRDSQGATALDYLEGRGPVPANPLLSGEERETARRLLTPPAH